MVQPVCSLEHLSSMTADTQCLPEQIVHACRRGEPKKIMKWLRSGSLEARRASDGSTLLHTAVSAGQPDIVREVLRRGADVNVHDDSGKTALMAAAQTGGVLEVQLLLEHSANVNQQTLQGATALMSSAAHNQPEVMSLLLKAVKASTVVDIQAATGDSALTVAATYGADACVQLLLNAGASIHLRNGSGNTALRCAENKGHVSAQLLLQRTSSRRRETTPVRELGSRQVRLELELPPDKPPESLPLQSVDVLPLMDVVRHGSDADKQDAAVALANLAIIDPMQRLRPNEVRIRTNDGKVITVDQSAIRTSNPKGRQCAVEHAAARRMLLTNAMQG